MSALLKLVLDIINQNTSIDMPKFIEPNQYLVGLFVSTFISSLFAFLIFKIAFKVTGYFKVVACLDGNESSVLHYTIRIILSLLVLLIFTLPFMTALVKIITIPVSEHLTTWFNNWTIEFTNMFMAQFTP